MRAMIRLGLESYIVSIIDTPVYYTPHTFKGLISKLKKHGITARNVEFSLEVRQSLRDRIISALLVA